MKEETLNEAILKDMLKSLYKNDKSHLVDEDGRLTIMFPNKSSEDAFYEALGNCIKENYKENSVRSGRIGNIPPEVKESVDREIERRFSK